MKPKMNTLKKGFTLIEMIVVMAVTAVLLTIISVPLINSFQITRAAQQDANSQDAARNLNTRIINELKNAVGVYDNTGIRGQVAVRLPGKDGTMVTELLPSAKVIIAQPAEAGAVDSNGGFIDPATGKSDPTLSGQKGQVVFPATAGDSIIMYIVGLKDPQRLYSNSYQQFHRGADRWDFAGTEKTAWTSRFKNAGLAHQATGEDNLYVLYRVQVNPYKWITDPANPSKKIRVVNTDFFVDLGRVNRTALAASTSVADQMLAARAATGGADINDPYLLDLNVQPPAYTSTITGITDPTTDDPADLSTSAKSKMIHNLLSHASIVTDVNRLDMILPQFDKSSLQVAFDGNNPRVASMASFRPTRVSSEPASPQLAVYNGVETTNAVRVGPEVYRTSMGSADNLSMQIFPSHYPSAFTSGVDEGSPRTSWQKSDPLLNVLPNGNGGLSLYGDAARELFDITGYMNQKAVSPAYAFSNNVKPLGPYALNFIPVVPQTKSGTVQTSFDVREFGNPSDRLGTDTDANAYLRNVPSSNATDAGIQVGPQALVTDPTYMAALWSDPTYQTPNERFAILYSHWDSLFPAGSAPSKDGPSGPKRYIDLRITPMFGASRTMGPLDPRNGVGRAAIAAGSEVVIGPDQTSVVSPPPLVTYTRVPNVDTVSVGPNQYKINYVDKPEPDWTSVFGFASPNYDPLHYDATDFLSAVLQARYRAGYLELNSRIGEPLPTGTAPQGNIYVTYRFLFTEPKDTVTASYDSSQSIETVLSVVTYGNPTTPIPGLTTVTGSAEVRNLLR